MYEEKRRKKRNFCLLKAGKLIAGGGVGAMALTGVCSFHLFGGGSEETCSFLKDAGFITS